MFRVALGLLTLICAAGQASSQTSTPLDRGRLDRATSPAALPPAQRPPAPRGVTSVEAGSQFAPAIRKIAFEGSDVPLVVAKAAEKFVGKPASRETLKALAAAMSEAYGRSPVALFTIAIPQQDFADGTVRVLVAEGYLEAVVLSGEVERRQLKLVRRYADRLTKERPTSRATLERYLSLIQDIPGLTVKSQLAMGSRPGGVRLILDLDYARPRLTFGFDNRTTQLVKDGQFQANARLFQTLREGDETTLQALASVNFKDLLYAGVSHATPIGTQGTRLGLNAGWLKTRPRGTSLKGEARSAGLTLSHPLIRSYQRNATISLALDGLNSKNAAFGSLIASERSRAVRGAASFAQSGRKRTFSASITASKGLGIFGAEVPATVGRAKFFKVNARATFDQAIGSRAAFRLRSSAQWTRDALPAVERFSVGGAEFGRAFEVGLINADRGVAGLAELAWRPIRSVALEGSEIYGFADAASARLLARPLFVGQNFTLASAGGGIRMAYTDKALVELEGAKVIDDPYPGYNGSWRLSLAWRLNLRP